LLARDLRSLDVAEEALQDAHVAALRRWPIEGEPDEPAAWLLAVARRRGRDRLRRDATLARKLPLLIVPAAQDPGREPGAIADERLRMLFTACHPALAPASRVALTLRYAAGLQTAEIARLFHVGEPAMAARLTRAKQKIHAAGIPYRVPEDADLPVRLQGVLDCVYLVFTEGHAPTRGDRVVRPELCAEAIRLGRLVRALAAPDPEIDGLLALMLLTHARSPARAGADGAPVLLADQDRGRWDPDLLAEGRALVPGTDGPFALQARIAAEHARGTTDWQAVAALYAALEAVRPTPAVRLNRAVAVAEADGPDAGLALLDGLDGPLSRTHGLHLARAELLRRAGDERAAGDAFARAAELAANDAVRAHIVRRANAPRTS
jgi:RNA polymerase sigma-70 factor (ECF subfamily)